MVECVSSCADFLVFLFVVIGFIPHTSCILLLFIVVCRGRGTFVSMWVVDRCASPQMLEVSFHHAFPTSMDRIMSTSCVCVSLQGFVRHVPATEVCPSVNICWRRVESLWPNSFVLSNFQNTWCSCFLLVCYDYSSHSAKRCLFRNEA